MNYFKMEIVVPVPSLGAIMEHVLATPNARVVDCSLLAVARKTTAARELPPPKKKRQGTRPEGKYLPLARGILGKYINTIEVGASFPIGPVIKMFKETGSKGNGALWKAVRELIEAEVLWREGGRGHYTRMK